MHFSLPDSGAVLGAARHFAALAVAGSESSIPQQEGDTLLVSECVSHQRQFYDRFEAVVLLSAPLDVIEARIRSRTTKEYGKRAAERELVRSDLQHSRGAVASDFNSRDRRNRTG